MLADRLEMVHGGQRHVNGSQQAVEFERFRAPTAQSNVREDKNDIMLRHLPRQKSLGRCDCVVRGARAAIRAVGVGGRNDGQTSPLL